MSDSFKAKVRKIGNSFGILIPKRIAQQEELKEGQEIQVSLLKERKVEDVLKLIGIAKGAKSFVRDRTDRLDRY